MQPATAVQPGHGYTDQHGAENEAQRLEGGGENNQQANAGGDLGQGFAVQFRFVVLAHDGRRAKHQVQQAKAHQAEHQQRVGAWADRLIGKRRLVGQGHHGQGGAHRQQGQGEDALQDHRERPRLWERACPANTGEAGAMHRGAFFAGQARSHRYL